MEIKSIEIKNFKSIKDSKTIKLKNINILIGSNGAGKTNFISFFELLESIKDKTLKLYSAKNGRADNIFYFGRKGSDYLLGIVSFDNNIEYKFKLVSDNIGDLVQVEDNISHNNSGQISKKEIKDNYSLENLLSIRIYHFNDTSFNSKIKSFCYLNDYSYLKEDGSNIAAFLYRFSKSYPKDFTVFENIVRTVAPFFERFHLVPDEINREMILLRWVENGTIFPASSLSDGNIRFVCLAALLMFPEKPFTIILDEPELGLHPFAIEELAAMVRVASRDSQIVVSTQSVDLINQFSADDIIVVERGNNQTTFKRQSEEELKGWLEDYSIGELWRSNLMGGNPV